MKQSLIEFVEAAPVLTEPGCASAAGDVQAILPLLKLMSEPNRLRIFALLAGGERCVCDIEADMRLPQNLVSHHLGLLRDAGFIRARRAGRWVYYSVNKEMLASVYPVICRLFNPECVNDGASNAGQTCRVCSSE
ncbi:MAG: metalloregulator ArsR/SmtB family transcription factor [Chloroflexi bacterium]|nr:metalloregulator ArsR/SmtB family transcription factor [Chloroflexota bacterium]MCL5275025.1 metalloregulator ArsR/SmtB family transcription factor [Chloroflexota bacterium]